MSDWKFKLGDRVKVLNSPADIDRSIGLQGTITEVSCCVTNWVTGDTSNTYVAKLDKGPAGQQVWALAFREENLELIDIDLGGA